MRDCAWSVERPSPNPDDEKFCGNLGTREVVVTFNGQRYLVSVCERHGKVHDDTAAQKRIARREANRQSKEVFEQRHRILMDNAPTH